MELKNKCDAVEKRESEKRQLEEKKHQEELQALKKTNQQLKVIVYSLINGKTIKHPKIRHRPVQFPHILSDIPVKYTG